MQYPTAIKICGVKDPAQAEAAVRAGAHFVGIMQYPESTRYVDIDTAKTIAEAVRVAGATPVGVFVDQDAQAIQHFCKHTGVNTVQLHGEVSRQANAFLPDTVTRFFVVPVEDDGRLEFDLEKHIAQLNPERDWLLFDRVEGGSGKVFAWKYFNPPRMFRFFLAGGLDALNVVEAISTLSPSGVDVSSGVEDDTGQKSDHLIATFIREVKSAEKQGRYGEFGGCYLPEGLMEPIHELEKGYREFINDKVFNDEFEDLLKNYAGRPTALTDVPRFSEAIGGPRIVLKREDLLHTGAHKINNALGQCLLAKRMHKTRVIAETGAGQHGVATATACAKLGLQCIVYMGAVDMARQAPNVERMRLLGADVVSVEHGAKTLKDAVNEALRDWSASYEHSAYCLGSALGPHPYPEMVARFQSVIGFETQAECLTRFETLPYEVVACVGGGSNAIGMFSVFLHESTVRLVGVEAGGVGKALGQHAARFLNNTKGVLHGTYSYLLQDEHGQVADTHSISAGLDYPSVGPQHAALHDAGRVTYTSVTDDEALHAFKLLTKTEGIIPALESSHALAYVVNVAKNYPKDALVVINLSGRGDKDLPQLFDMKLV